jgi:microcystin-dependent protein
MSDPYIGEIRMFGGNFAPAGWAFCQGQLVPISEYDTLFNLIGTTYGGDGQSTFGLPNLQGRVPVHTGPGMVLGQMAGSESVTLTTQQLPVHTHPMAASSDAANVITGANGVLAASVSLAAYFASPPDAALNAASVLPVGGNQPHENMQPYLAINFIISLFGIYPNPS